ncbi:uncharacterized protein N7459_002028 [Penicillium hispanicum]|uniref:uncharacterized protein n=1 Tax=Penicillium hispanicum TaxID=1080232 RepID=UPI0025409F8F|nr:uncharacterized protein N7459_002028 [Penicillium hispanicum]KAJ5591659.1 hypothetical protein N7459_002028 [Penicillium hispanicum]
MTDMDSGLHVGQRFSSLEEFKNVIRSISVRQYWNLRVIRSNKKSVVIGCRSGSNCFFRVVCRCNKNATYITSLQDNHTCRRDVEVPTRMPARSEASHVRFLLSEIPKLFDTKTKIKGQDVVDAVKRYHGYDIAMRQAQRALIKLQKQGDSNQSDQALGMDLSAGDQQSPTQSPAESQGEAGPAYRDMSEHRWIPDSLQPPLMNDEAANRDQSPSHHASAVPAPPAVQSGRPTQMPPPIGTPNQSGLSNDSRPVAVSQSAVGYPTTAPLPVAGTEHPKPPNYQPRGDHSTIPHMVLTNFKIEFTCTTCGSLNQSFFPNQGNVTGDAYLGHHSVPSQSAVARHADPSQNGTDGNNPGVAEDGSYAINALNARVMQNAWATGSLGVPIGPTNP